jgi:hypothetical protein
MGVLLKQAVSAYWAEEASESQVSLNSVHHGVENLFARSIVLLEAKG